MVTWKGGSQESLDRLVAGQVDEAEAARVRARTLLPWETLEAPAEQDPSETYAAARARFIEAVQRKNTP